MVSVLSKVKCTRSDSRNQLQGLPGSPRRSCEKADQLKWHTNCHIYPWSTFKYSSIHSTIPPFFLLSSLAFCFFFSSFHPSIQPSIYPSIVHHFILLFVHSIQLFFLSIILSPFLPYFHPPSIIQTSVFPLISIHPYIHPSFFILTSLHPISILLSFHSAVPPSSILILSVYPFIHLSFSLLPSSKLQSFH